MDRRSSYPTPIEFQAPNHGSGLSIITLTMTDTAVAACKRCATCTAISEPQAPGRFVCANVVPIADRDNFLFGPVDGTSAGSSVPSAETKSAKRRRADAIAVDDAARDLVAAVLSEQDEYDTEIDTGIDDDEAGHRALDKLDETIKRAKRVFARVASRAPGRFGLDALAATLIVADEHVVAVVPPELVDRLTVGGTFVVPIPKSAIVKATRPR